MKTAMKIMLAGMLLWTSVATGQDAQPDAAKSAEAAADEAESDTAEKEEEEEEEESNDIRSREKLTGNWGGNRDKLVDSGVTINFDGTYILQGVADGGLQGPLFDAFSNEGQVGNTFSSDLQIELDTGKAGLWQDGTLYFRLEGRAGRSVVQRAGSVSAVNNDALFPNVIDEFDTETVALTELTYEHSLGEKTSIFVGLLNTAEGDENEIAGFALSNAHFLNSAMLYSLVEDATVPNVSLGGGISFEPNEEISGSFSVFGTPETAGENPFELWNGTTFSTEWTFAHQLANRPGAQTLGALYGIDASRTNIAASPRVVIGSILLGLPIPATEADTWALYYNAHQFIRGDAEDGWGVFMRFGVSDGNPNVVKRNVAFGVGGIGLLPSRKQDNWGLGTFYLDMSDADLLQGLGVRSEVGGEWYYNIAVIPSLHITLDAQLIDSALPNVDTTTVLGVRTHFDF